MEIKIRYVGKQLCLINFALTNDEIILKYGKKNIFNNQKVLKEIKELIDNIWLDEELAEKGIVTIGSKDIRYFNDIVQNRPLVGVAKIAFLPESVNLNLPMAIDPNVYKWLEKSFTQIDKQFKKRMLEVGFCIVDDVNKITETSTIYYDLLYTKNGQVLNTIPDQSFDMINDDDMDPYIFINMRVGDQVLVDEQDICIEALIKKITDKIPFSENNYNVEEVKMLGMIDFTDMKNRYSEGFKYIYRINAYLDFILDFASEHSEYEISNELKEYYQNKSFSTYKTDGKNINEDLLLKRKIFYDLFDKMVKLKSPGRLIDFSEENDMFLKTVGFYLDREKGNNTVIDLKNKLHILRYFRNEKITKGIDV